MSVPFADVEIDAFPVRRSMLLACSVALVLSLAVSAQVYLSMLSHGHSLVRLAGWQLGNWIFWGLVAPVVLRAGGALTDRPPIRGRFVRAVALWLLLMGLHAVIVAALTAWIRPFYPLPSTSFRNAFVNQLPSLFVIDSFVFGILLASGSAYQGNRRARRHELRESRLEAELARAHLDALRLEIQPHFLFNTLNSISALIRLKDHAGALKMLLGLGDLMRTAVEGPKRQLVALSGEIEFVKRYVDLQRARFGERLQVQFQVGEDCNDATVPTFLLQPLVENALRHGAAPLTGPCHIRIGACTEAGRLRLWVSDDGVGLPRGFDVMRDAGTGLNNTMSRLSQLYGSAASFDVRAEPGAGTIVEIGFPCAPLAAAAAVP